MKWKRSRKTKEQASPSSPLAGSEEAEMDMISSKQQRDSLSSSPEDDDDLELGDGDEKEAVGQLRPGSLNPTGFLRNVTGNYISSSEGELEEAVPRTRSAIHP